MAILKHLSSKNSDYGKALEYLMFQHNETTQQPLLDANGKKMLREEFYLDGINCDPFSFDKECEQVNGYFHKNQKRNEIKSHHYILSFDPLDATESGLTGKRAQALGLEFARKYFPGHQVLVCTHMDGHNGSGNVHCHIVLNSVRKLDVDPQSFSERACDCKAGYKHHQTRDYLTAMQEGLMEITKREGLHQVDLLSSAPVKKRDKEYWKNDREQKKLDKLNQQIIADGMKPRRTKYQSQKQFLQEAIREVSAYAHSEQEFEKALQEKYGIGLKLSRGRYSYLHPDRERYITGRSLGNDFEKDTLLRKFAENEKNGITQEMVRKDHGNNKQAAKSVVSAPVTPDLPEYDPTYDYDADPAAILFIRSNLHLVVDLQTNIKAQQSAAYAQKVKLSNLKEMAKTVCYIQENNYDTREDLETAYQEISEKFTTARKTLRSTEDRIKELNEQIHYVGQYMAHKTVYREFLKAKNKKRFREEHRTELELYESGVKYIKEKLESTVPSLKGLKAERNQLQIMKDAQYGTYRYFQEYQKELRTVCTNVDTILEKDRSSERDKNRTAGISK